MSELLGKHIEENWKFLNEDGLYYNPSVKARDKINRVENLLILLGAFINDPDFDSYVTKPADDMLILLAEELREASNLLK